MIRTRTARRSAAGAALGVAALIVPLAALAGPAAASAPNPNTPEPVASGINVAALPGAVAFGDTPASTPETVSFILRERNLTLLELAADTGSKNYLSTSEFPSRYGQTPANVTALTSYLAHFGITTDVYADNVDVSASGTAGEFDRALSVTQKQFNVPKLPGHAGFNPVPAQNGVHANTQSPSLPYRLSSFVLAVLGLFQPFFRCFRRNRRRIYIFFVIFILMYASRERFSVFKKLCNNFPFFTTRFLSIYFLSSERSRVCMITLKSFF